MDGAPRLSAHRRAGARDACCVRTPCAHEGTCALGPQLQRRASTPLHRCQMSGDPDFLSLAQAARAIKVKRISPVELTDTCLTRIAHGNSRLNAFVTVTEEQARAQASEAERPI